MGNKHFLLCFWAAACTLWISAGGRAPSPSRTERNGSGSRRLDRPQATTPWSPNRSVGGRENVERSDGWMSDGERLPRCFVLRTRKTSKLGGAPEVENPINYAARGHTIFITNTVHTPCLPGMCENPRLMCVPLCPLRASWLFSWRCWTHDWSCGAFVVAKRRPEKPISGTAALFHIHKFEY